MARTHTITMDRSRSFNKPILSIASAIVTLLMLPSTCIAQCFGLSTVDRDPYETTPRMVVPKSQFSKLRTDVLRSLINKVSQTRHPDGGKRVVVPERRFFVLEQTATYFKEPRISIEDAANAYIDDGYEVTRRGSELIIQGRSLGPKYHVQLVRGASIKAQSESFQKGSSLELARGCDARFELTFDYLNYSLYRDMHNVIDLQEVLVDLTLGASLRSWNGLGGCRYSKDGKTALSPPSHVEADDFYKTHKHVYFNEFNSSDFHVTRPTKHARKSLAQIHCEEPLPIAQVQAAMQQMGCATAFAVWSVSCGDSVPPFISYERGSTRDLIGFPNAKAAYTWIDKNKQIPSMTIVYDSKVLFDCRVNDA